jgi:hypothetical protein
MIFIYLNILFFALSQGQLAADKALFYLRIMSAASLFKQ